MTWAVPDWYGLLILSLASFRLWHLLAHDQILDRPRQRVIRPDSKREEFVECPYCLGAWCSIGWWWYWLIWPHWALIIAVPFAISALVALIASNLNGE